MNDAERGPEQDGEKNREVPERPEQVPVSGSGPEEQKKAFAELNDRFLRLAADFENFKKRTCRERETAVACANERFAVDMLEVVDNFDRALKSDDSRLREGLEQIRQLLDAQLQRQGITPIDSLKKTFNPVEHDAVAHVPSDEPEGLVIDEITKGYRMNDRVIRCAKVAVSRGKENNPR